MRKQRHRAVAYYSHQITVVFDDRFPTEEILFHKTSKYCVTGLGWGRLWLIATECAVQSDSAPQTPFLPGIKRKSVCTFYMVIPSSDPLILPAHPPQLETFHFKQDHCIGLSRSQQFGHHQFHNFYLGLPIKGVL